HIATCASCAAMAAEVTGAVAFMERAANVEPPPELLTRIMHEMPASGLSLRKSWRRILSGNFLGRWIEPLLQPRYAMGMAMTVLSFSMLVKFAGIDARQLRPSDLDPVKVWSALDDRAHRAWDRGMKYYDNLRIVIETEARLKQWADQEQATPTAKQRQNQPQRSKQQ
ncbi:MAG: hypothetical protein ACRD4P_07430, partial [Bryobacteraceae bacterium]